MRIETKFVDCDKDFHLARSVRLRIYGKEIVAPKRALSASGNRIFNEVILQNEALRGLVEVYRRLDPNKVHKILNDNVAAARFSVEISFSIREVKEDEIILGLFEYDAQGKMPTLDHTNMLLHILNNPHFDAVAVPFIPKLPCEDYIQFLESFIEVYKSSSFRPALAPFIPHYSISSVPALFSFYAKKDIFENNLICVDFNGSNPISQYMFVSAIVKEAIKLEKETDQTVFLHAVNLKYGKATKRLEVVPAKDLVIFTMGFNSFGSNHKRVAILNDVGVHELKTKLLNRDDYGYYSLEAVRNRMEDTQRYQIRMNDVVNNKKLAKLFNAERQGLESVKISEEIKERELKRYLLSKRQIANEQLIWKRISKVHNKALQKTLLEA